jgi:hypothetical protein
MTVSKTGHDPVDEARHQLCHGLATGIHEGNCSFQIRIQQPHGIPVEAWIYTQVDHEFRKRNDLAIAPELAGVLMLQLETLAGRDFTDAWSLRRADHHDRIDFELKFRHDVVSSHVTDNLESYLYGCLFHGHHDTGKDARHRIGFRNS